MATYTIGTGGTYTTLEAFFSDVQTGTIGTAGEDVIGELISDVTITGTLVAITQSTMNSFLLRPQGGIKRTVFAATAADLAFNTSRPIQIEDLFFDWQNEGTSSSSRAVIYSTGSATHVTCNRVWVTNVTDFSLAAGFNTGTANGRLTCNSCLATNMNANNKAVGFDDTSLTNQSIFNNCTAHDMNGGTESIGFDAAAGNALFRNCAATNMLGAGPLCFTGGTQTTNLSSDATAVGQTNQSAAATWVNPTAGSYDLTPLLTGAALDNGTSLGPGDEAIDFNGWDRTQPDRQPWDIGAIEASKVGPGADLPVPFTNWIPSRLRPAWTVNNGQDLNPGHTTDSYMGGNPAVVTDLKPSIVDYQTSYLKPGLTIAGDIKPSILLRDAPPPFEGFVTEWDTSLTSTGSSASNQISLPLVSGGVYNFTVEWGDGQQDTITAWNQAETTHTYSAPGVYQVIMDGTIEGWRFNDGGDRLKLLKIFQWTPLVLQSLTGCFYGCSNLILLAGDAPVFAGTNSFNNIFRDCTSLTGPVNQFDLTLATNYSNAFRSCFPFNSPTSNLFTGNELLCSSFLSGCFAYNYLVDTKNAPLSNMGSMFYQAAAFNQPVTTIDTSSAATLSSTFRDCTSFDQDMSSLDLSSATNVQSFLEGTTLSSVNYDSSLVAWEQQSLNPSLTFHGGNSKFSHKSTPSRERMIWVDNWTITDGGFEAKDDQSPRLANVDNTRALATPSAAMIAVVNDFTAMCWVRSEETEFGYPFAHWVTGTGDRKWALGLRPDATILQFRVFVDGAGDFSTQYKEYRVDGFPLNTWIHIAFTFSSAGVLLLYQNGIEVSSSRITETRDDPMTSCFASTGVMSIGERGDQLGFGLTGNVFDARFYDRLLTESEIASIVTDPLPILHPSDLLAHYRLDDPVTGWLDTSGQGQNMTPTGPITYPQDSPFNW